MPRFRVVYLLMYCASKNLNLWRTRSENDIQAVYVSHAQDGRLTKNVNPML